MKLVVALWLGLMMSRRLDLLKRNTSSSFHTFLFIWWSFFPVLV